MALTFTLLRQEGGYSLYSASVGGAYLLLLPGGVAHPETLGFGASWPQDQWAAAYLVSEAAPAGGLARLAEAVALDPRITNQRALAWLPAGGTPVVVRMSVTGATGGQLRGGDNAEIPFGSVALEIQSGSDFTVQPDAGTFAFPLGTAELRWADGQGGVPPRASTVIALDGGRIAFSVKRSAREILRLTRDPGGVLSGGEIRYFYPDSAGAVRQLVYPLFAPPATGDTWALDATMDPLAPNDGARTSLLFQAGAVPPLASTFARTTAGTPVTLTPQPGAGFWLGARPRLPGDQDAGAHVYLAPQGAFKLGFGGARQRLMGGLSALEYLEAEDGDILELVPSCPAFAAAMGTRALRSSGEPDPPLLSPEYNTSWVRLRPAGARGYFAQPSAAVNYGAGALPRPTTYPGAVAARISDVGAAEPAAFPMALYGGVYPPPGTTAWPNQGTDPAAFSMLERSVLTLARQAALKTGDHAGPVFAGQDGKPLGGSRTTTPQGLLVSLNSAQPAASDALGAKDAPPAGSWNRLVLARRGGDELAFNAGDSGVVDPALATTLLHNEVFLVLNNWARFGKMDRALTLAGFEFEVAPDADSADPTATLLVFKYSTAQSLRALVHAPGSWAAPETFLAARPGGDPVGQAQAALIEALAVADAAEKEADDPFAHFRALADRPEWTGIVAFNCPINGNGMPLDLQMLLAGIDGQLMAHHFGVELNRISAGEPAIEESSLFGVIHYESPSPPAVTPPPPFQYFVEELNVAIENSVVTQFHARVGMQVNQLFGRPVWLYGDDGAPQADNTVSILGKYQRQGDVGTLTFTAPEKAAFRFNPEGHYLRVLDRFVVTGAGLAPVARKDQDKGSSSIHARFTLAGELYFAESPFPAPRHDDDPHSKPPPPPPGLDLFGYGSGGAGLPVSGLALDLAFELDADGKRTRPPVITPDYTGVQLTEKPAAIRPGALLKGLPLKLTGFLQNEKGLDTGAIGASPVQTPLLQGNGATRPTFALRLELPIGSLGSLSEVHAALTAYLVLAWGPSSTAPDNDAAGVYVQLPSASAGIRGFNLQGMVKTVFGDANLVRIPVPAELGMGPGWAYMLLFNNVAISVMGIRLPPKVITDFLLFSNPHAPAGSSVAWNLAATQVSK